MKMVQAPNYFEQCRRAYKLMKELDPTTIGAHNMSTGKLLDKTTLHGFTNHPRRLISELIGEAKKNRNTAVTEEEAEHWRTLVDKLIEAYNAAPMKR